MNRDLELQLWNAIADKLCSPADWISWAVKDGAVSSTKQPLATLEKWSREGCYDYGVAIDRGWAVVGKRPARFAGPVTCVGCENTIAEGDAHVAGWRFATIHTGEADWLCRECRIDDEDDLWF